MENPDEHDLYIDLLRDIKNQGHEIYVVCPKERRFNKKTVLKQDVSIKTLFVKTGNITKSNYFEKGIAVLLLPWQYLFNIKRYFKWVEFDLILYSTPPITFETVVKKLKTKTGAVTYLLLKDIWPQGIIDLGVIKSNSLMHKYFRAKEKSLYRISDYIGCMSQANVDYVINHNPFIEADKIEICPNSIEPLDININAVDKINIRNKYGIPEDKIVFIYGCNLGKPQGIDFLMQCL